MITSDAHKYSEMTPMTDNLNNDHASWIFSQNLYKNMTNKELVFNFIIKFFNRVLNSQCWTLLKTGATKIVCTLLCDYYSEKMTSEVFFIELISESLAGTHIQSDNAKAWHFLLKTLLIKYLRMS